MDACIEGLKPYLIKVGLFFNGLRKKTTPKGVVKDDARSHREVRASDTRFGV